MQITADSPADGVVIAQPARGYRYSADAFLVGGAALRDGLPARSLDLGTGCGVIPFLFARLGVDAVGLEAQPAWQAYWEHSCAHSVVVPELRTLRVQELDEDGFDVVTCNPPYFPKGSGPISPDPLKAAANTELDGVLVDFVSAAARALHPDGRAAFVVPRERGEELLVAFADVGLGSLRRIRIGGRRTVVIARRGPPGVLEESMPARGDGVDALYARILGRPVEPLST